MGRASGSRLVIGVVDGSPEYELDDVSGADPRFHDMPEDEPMRYLLTVFTDPDRSDDADPGAWRAYDQALTAAGVLVGGNRLAHPATATTVRLEEGRRLVQDGPFADSREQLGGYVVVDVASLDEALEWAARCPAASFGTIEVRPIMAAALPAR